MVPDIEPIIVTEEGIVNLLNTLQPNKAGGPDKIPSRFLKEYGTLLSPALTLIFHFKLLSARGKSHQIGNMLPLYQLIKGRPQMPK